MPATGFNGFCGETSHQISSSVEVPERQQADMQMPAMGRVERAAEQADAAMPAGDSAGARRDAAQGRTCPLPRTRYL